MITFFKMYDKLCCKIECVLLSEAAILTESESDRQQYIDDQDVQIQTVSYSGRFIYLPMYCLDEENTIFEIYS